MKPIKMLGLTALAALLAMAFVGASSAMAEMPTALCTADELPCPPQNIASHVHLVTTTKAKLLTNLISVECDVLFLGDVLADPTTGSRLTLFGPLIIDGNFSYANCASGCTVTEENGPSLLEVLKFATEEATVTGEGLVHVNCGIFINCRYIGEGLEGLAEGPLKAGGNGTVTISGKAVEKEGGLLCPEAATLDIQTTSLAANKNWISG